MHNEHRTEDLPICFSASVVFGAQDQ